MKTKDLQDKVQTKLFELWELVKEVPEDCKGPSEEAYKNRRTWMKMRTTIHNLIDNDQEFFWTFKNGVNP